MRFTHSRERSFLLSSLNNEIDKEKMESLIKRNMKWSYAIDKAKRLNIAPLVYHNYTNQHLQNMVPANVLKEFKKIYLENKLRNMLFYNTLKCLLLVFQKHNIPTVVLKGAALAEVVYGDIALRGMIDVDLLIKEDHLATIDNLMLQQGFKSYDRKKTGYHHAFISPDGNILVEIHWTLNKPYYPFHLDQHTLWSRVQRVNIAGMETCILNPADMILYLTADLSLDNRNLFVSKLKYLCDIYQLIHFYGKEINWEQFRKETEGHERYVYYPLYMTKKMLGANVPEWVLRELKNNSDVNKFEDYTLKYVIKKSLFIPKWSFIGTFRRVPIIVIKNLLSEENMWKKLMLIFIHIFFPPLYDRNGNNASFGSSIRRLKQNLIQRPLRIVSIFYNKWKPTS